MTVKWRGPQKSIVGRWIVAKTLIGARYPCSCLGPSDRDCRTTWCTRWGRTDLDGLPELCCARTAPAPTTTEEPTR